MKTIIRLFNKIRYRWFPFKYKPTGASKPRIDLICVDDYGCIKVVEGRPSDIPSKPITNLTIIHYGKRVNVYTPE